MKRLKDRNQAAVGGVALTLLVLSVLAALNADRLPLIGGGTTYAAYFAESAGLQPDNEVQLAGVRIGAVSDVELEGKKVLVTFRVDKQGLEAASRLGSESTASIEIKTLLGEKYLALKPAGEGQLDPQVPIPLSRTTTPFQIQDAFNELNETIGEVDTAQLAKSFDVLSESFGETSQHFGKALRGMAALSNAVASRDDELASLLGNSRGVAKLLAGRRDQLQKVISDGNLLLGELQSRKEAIALLLRGTRSVSEQLSGLVADNRKQMKPTLEKLDRVTSVLHRNSDNLDRALEMLAPFTRIGSNATANGRWFEGYLCGLFPPTITAAGVQINPRGCETPVSAPGQGIGGN